MTTQLLIVFVLIFLEIALSMDNALAIAALVTHLPRELRGKALTYGIWGAVGFRIAALFFIQKIIAYQWIRLAGALYLFYLAIKHFFWDGQEVETKIPTPFHFWRIVLAVEITDIAFSADSVLASMIVTDNYLIMATGGVIGIVAMRFAAGFMSNLMHTFPKLEDAAYLLVSVAGARLLLEWAFDIQIPETMFYGILIGCFAYGFRKRVRII